MNSRPSRWRRASRSQKLRRPEAAAFFFTLDDQTDGDALHASRAETGLHLFPQHRRQRVAIQAVEDAAAFLRADQVFVDVVRVLDRLVDRVFGDFVKDDAPDRHLRLEHLFEVPAD